MKITAYDYEGKELDPPSLNSVWSEPETETLSEEVLDVAYAYVKGTMSLVSLTKGKALNLQFKTSNGKYESLQLSSSAKTGGTLSAVEMSHSHSHHNRYLVASQVDRSNVNLYVVADMKLLATE